MLDRQNLNFKKHLKHLAQRTICFSKSVEMHDRVIGQYIARSYFNYLNTQPIKLCTHATSYFGVFCLHPILSAPNNAPLSLVYC
ncbi:MAG: IS1 family transposase [Thiolinea sp.]